MFLKLIKQDVRATARLMLPVYAGGILLAVFARVLDEVSARMPESMFVTVFGGLVGFLFELSMVAIVVMSFVLMIWRFSKNYMTDEGYLMFTLPVSTAQLIWSKLVVAVGWFFCSGVVSSLATWIVSAGTGTVEIVGFDQITDGTMMSTAVSIVASTLISGIAFCLMLYACMALGQSFKRHKKGMAVLFFFLFSIVIMVVSVKLISSMLIMLSDNPVVYYDAAALEPLLNKTAWISAAVSAGFGAVFYAITHFMLAKRLNLQ